MANALETEKRASRVRFGFYKAYWHDLYTVSTNFMEMVRAAANNNNCADF